MLAKEAPGDSINTVSFHVKVMTANWLSLIGSVNIAMGN